MEVTTKLYIASFVLGAVCIFATFFIGQNSRGNFYNSLPLGIILWVVGTTLIGVAIIVPLVTSTLNRIRSGLGNLAEKAKDGYTDKFHNPNK